MGALLIINYDVTDPERLKAYRAPAGEALVGDAPDKGTARVFTRDTVDLGEGAGGGTNTVALEFESVEAAQAAYASEAYQAVVGERLAATDPKFAIIVPTM